MKKLSDTGIIETLQSNKKEVGAKGFGRGKREGLRVRYALLLTSVAEVKSQR